MFIYENRKLFNPATIVLLARDASYDTFETPFYRPVVFNASKSIDRQSPSFLDYRSSCSANLIDEEVGSSNAIHRFLGLNTF